MTSYALLMLLAGGVLASLVNQQGEEPFLEVDHHGVVGDKPSALSELETYASSAQENSSDEGEDDEEEDDDEDEEEAG